MLQWYELIDIDSKSGKRVYQIARRYADEMWPVASLIEVKSSQPASLQRAGQRGKYVLDDETHQRIIKYGSI